MATSTIPNLNVKKVSKVLITSASGKVSGSLLDLFGVSGATFIGIYFERGSYSVNRKVEVECYGGAGYTFIFYDGGSPVASLGVSATLYYV